MSDFEVMEAQWELALTVLGRLVLVEPVSSPVVAEQAERCDRLARALDALRRKA